MDAEKKRKFNELSPEKKSQATKFVQSLASLSKDNPGDDDIVDIFCKMSDFMGDLMDDEYLRRFDKLDEKLENTATAIQIHQLEGQVASVKSELEGQLKDIRHDMVEKELRIHDLETKNEELETRLARIEQDFGAVKQNQLNAKHHACNNEQYQRKDNLLICIHF